METYLKIIGFLLCLEALVSGSMPSRGRPHPSGYGQSFPNYFLNYAANDSRVSVYKPESELCCSGNVFPSPPNSYHQCCGSSQFDTTRQKCCEGVVFDLRPGFDCCGSEYFSIKEAKCCISPLDGKQILKQFPEAVLGDANAIHSTMCCGLKLYNTKTHICCSGSRGGYQDNFGGYPGYSGGPTGPRMRGGRVRNERQVYGYPGGQMSGTHYIIYEKKFTNTACCKDKIYDRSKDTCDEPQHDVYHTQYNSQFAAPNYPQAPMKDRCNSEEFNPKTHICCSHYSKQNGGEETIVENKLLERQWPSTSCCGGETFDYETQICCNNKIREQNEDGSMECCGEETFDVKTQQCCESSKTVTDTESLGAENDSCCGSEKIPFNSKKQLCCGNKVFDLPETDPNARYNQQCCWHAASNSEPSLYKPRRELCCDGVKHDNKDHQGTCCGSQLANWENDLCCSGEILNKTSNNDWCCGKQKYDSMTHLCCDPVEGVVAPKKSRYESCCGLIPYDYEKEVCCRSNSVPRGFPMSTEMLNRPEETAVFPRSSPSTSCCGLNVVDLDTHQCCGSKPIENSKELCCHYLDENHNFQGIAVPKITHHARCCGRDAYDPSTERCCNNTVVAAGDQGLECCGSSLYDTEKQICCSGAVHDLGEEKVTTKCCVTSLYDTVSQVCCQGAVKQIGNSSPATDCCYPVNGL